MADLTYKMTVTLTDGTEVDAGTFTAPQGPAGPAGADGADGADGAQGPTGPAGANGENGRPAIIYSREVNYPAAATPTTQAAFALPLEYFAPAAPLPNMSEVFIYLVKLSNGVSGIGIGEAMSRSGSQERCRCITFVQLTGVQSVSISQV